MRLEEFKSLTEDELAILWYAVNKTTPPVLDGVELEPSVFCAIKPQAIRNRVDQIELAVKDEHKSIYESLRQKLHMAPIVPPVSSSVETSNTTPTSDSPSV